MNPFRTGALFVLLAGALFGEPPRRPTATEEKR